MYVTSQAVARALTLLDYLTRNPKGVEREQIQHTLADYRQAVSEAAFERMFERDKQLVRALGRQLEVKRAPWVESGYLYCLRPQEETSLDLSVAELMLIGQAAASWREGSLAKLAQGAVLKMTALAHLPSLQGGQTSALLRDQEGLFEVLTALAEGKGISCTYQGSSRIRQLTCWGIGLKYGHWYLAAFDSWRAEERLFRLDRMAAIKRIPQDGPLAPADFSMEQRLSSLSSQDLPFLAVQRPEAARGQLDFTPSYGLKETVIEQLASGASLMPCLEDLPLEGVDADYQRQAAELENHLRTSLSSWHGQRPKLSPPPATSKAWKPLKAQRSRESASQQLIRLLLILSFLEAEGGAYLSDVADFFQVSEQKIRSDLNTLEATSALESVQLSWSEDNWLELPARSSLVGVGFTDLEVLLLVLGLEQLALLDNSGLIEILVQKLWQLIPAQSDLKPSLVYIAPLEQDNPLRLAMEQGKGLEILYRSYQGLSRRIIEPVDWILDNGPRYLRAWCRQSASYRIFRLEGILSTGPLLAGGLGAAQGDPGQQETPQNWLRQIKEGGGEEDLLLALPKNIPLALRQKTGQHLSAVAKATAESSEAIFFRIPLVNQAWALKLLLELGPTIYLLSPETIRNKLLGVLDYSEVNGG